MKHLFKYKWYLKDGYPAPGISKNNYNVFGTFICGGGSTMGYKLAGFNHLGGVEIDKRISEVYKINHNPKYLYTQDLREFNKRTDLPDELYKLDILDGSPPCSSFSMAGNREKDWNKNKVFREGQTKQILDDLVFVYCETILKLKPKIFILENVKGLISGNAKVYAKSIINKLEAGGYKVQLFLLNAASMGVPQRRERVFFIGHKKEYQFNKLSLAFNERNILFKEIDAGDIKGKEYNLRPSHAPYALICKGGKSLSSVHPKGHCFNTYKQDNNLVSATIVADNGGGIMIHSSGKRYLTDDEYKQIGSFPMDYHFNNMQAKYIIGMSVPPVMIAQIANQIKLQWLMNCNNNV